MPLLDIFKKQGLKFAKNQYANRYGAGQGASGRVGGPRKFNKPSGLGLFAIVAVFTSFIGMILALVSLFAGASPGMVTDAYIIQLDTSKLGKDIIGNLKIRDVPPEALPVFMGAPSVTPSSTATLAPVKPRSEMPTMTQVPDIQERQIGGLLDKAKDKAKEVTSKAGSGVDKATSAAKSVADAAATTVNNAANDLVEKVSQKLGIKDFYNLHVMDTCDGFFQEGNKYNVSNCTVPLQTAQANVSALIDKELGVGPLKFNLAKLGIVGELQDKLNVIPDTFRALAAAYIAGAGLAALGLLTSVAGVICTICGGLSLSTTAPKKLMLLTGANMAILGGSAIALFVGSMVTTVWGGAAVSLLNKLGNPVGLFASVSVKFQAMSWGAFIFVMIAALVWTLGFLQAFKLHKANKRVAGPAYKGSRGIEAGATSPYPAYGPNKEMHHVSGSDLVHSDHQSSAGSLGYTPPPPPPVPAPSHRW